MGTNMQPHQQRVIDEYKELFDRTRKLAEFFDTKIFTSLDPKEQDRLTRQWQHMQQYGQVLSERISAFV